MKAYRQGVSSRNRVWNRYRRQYPPRSSSIGSTLSENDCSDDHVSFSNSSVRSQRGTRSTSARPCSTQSKPNDDEVDPQNASVSRVERIASIVPDVSFSTYGGERWLESLDQREIFCFFFSLCIFFNIFFHPRNDRKKYGIPTCVLEKEIWDSEIYLESLLLV